MKSRKRIIEIEIALIDKKNSYITRALVARLQQREGFSLSLPLETLHFRG